MLSYNLYRGLSDRQKAESQKRDNLFYLTLDEMRKAGEDPYEQYPEDLFDVSQYPEFAGIAPSGSPEEMRRETINAAIYNWRERNQDIVQQAYDAFLRSGLDYDEYKKRLEEGEPVEEEEEDIFKDTTGSDVPKTPKELFQESTIEEKQEQIQSILDESPDATIDDILRVMQNWGISAELFKSATGYYPRGYVAQRDGTGGTGGEEGGDDDGGEEPSPEECQPGYERWNGSCVPVCNAAAGYVRDEATGQCVLKEETPKPPEPPPPCPDGYVYDEASQSCIPVETGGDDGGNGGDNGKTCPTGYVYDEASQSCVPIKEEVTGGDGDLNGPIEKPTPGLPQQPTTEPTQQGMFAFAASPNRTTSEVLAPDLFKIDANIPLVGRLTQVRPMAAPQYLLSGISQRYKV